jgi:hypothetical protein
MRKTARIKEIISGTGEGTGQAPGLIHFMSETGEGEVFQIPLVCIRVQVYHS